VRERLEREFDLELISTAPNVEFHVFRQGEEIVVHNPAEMPPGGDYDRVEEPIVDATIITPSEYLGAVFDLCQGRRGEMVGMEYLTPERVEVHYVLPLAEIVFDFFDQLKSRTRLTAIRSRSSCGSTSCSTATRSTPSRAWYTATRRTSTASG
jgi:GTP-binding protein LepA